MLNRLERKFVYEKKELNDPDPNMTAADVQQFYSGTYPELLNAKMEGPKIENDREIYTFSTSLKPKG